MEQYVCNQDMLYGYIASLLPNRADADDVFQETSLILWENRGNYDPERSFIAWSYGIARNVVANYVRKNKNRGVTLNPDLFSKVEAARQRVGDALQRQADAMQECLERVSEKQRAFVVNCYSGQSSISQVAAEMGVSENALHQRLSRLRRQLMDCIRRALQREGVA
jgi:RNA polymerase sigma-70 factor, ECF subfamily